MKKFNNKHNKEYKVKDGEHEKTIFHVRSTAVVAVLIAKYKNEFYTLVNKRGPGCPDNIDKWCCTCGYLDWDETLKEAVVREVWEESGVDVDNILLHYDILKDDLDTPFFINDKTSENRQNISLSFGLLFECDELPETTNKYNEPGETSDIQWIKINELDKYDFAYNHNERILMYVKKCKLFIFYK
jgi:8-oxo-dGTP pyrophosphatase MutT (NUDIX family)